MESTEQRRRFGLALRAARKRSRRTQAEVGRLIDKDQTVVSVYERGEAEPPRDVVARLEEILALDAGDLSRYLGYVPVDPADAPEPVDPGPMLTGHAIAEITKATADMQQAIAPWAQEVLRTQQQMQQEIARLRDAVTSITHATVASYGDLVPARKRFLDLTETQELTLEKVTEALTTEGDDAVLIGRGDDGTTIIVRGPRGTFEFDPDSVDVEAELAKFLADQQSAAPEG